jgi:hypothetical protein
MRIEIFGIYEGAFLFRRQLPLNYSYAGHVRTVNEIHGSKLPVRNLSGKTKWPVKVSLDEF